MSKECQIAKSKTLVFELWILFEIRTLAFGILRLGVFDGLSLFPGLYPLYESKKF